MRQPREEFASQMYRGLAVAVVAIPEIEIGHDRTGAERVRSRFARVFEQAFINWDAHDDVRSSRSRLQHQLFLQHFSAKSVGIERL